MCGGLRDRVEDETGIERERDQCQTLDTIRMVARVCFHLFWILASEFSLYIAHASLPWLRPHWRIRLGGMLDTCLLLYPHQQTAPSFVWHTVALFSSDKTRINRLSWMMASHWEPIRQSQQLKESVHWAWEHQPHTGPYCRMFWFM